VPSRNGTCTLREGGYCGGSRGRGGQVGTGRTFQVTILYDRCPGGAVRTGKVTVSRSVANLGPRLLRFAAGGLRRRFAPDVQAGGGEGKAEGSLVTEVDRVPTPSSCRLVASGPVWQSENLWHLSGCLKRWGGSPLGTTTFFFPAMERHQEGFWEGKIGETVSAGNPLTEPPCASLPFGIRHRLSSFS